MYMSVRSCSIFLLLLLLQTKMIIIIIIIIMLIKSATIKIDARQRCHNRRYGYAKNVRLKLSVASQKTARRTLQPKTSICLGPRCLVV